MNQSIKSLLALVILVLLIACALGWAMGDIPDVPRSGFWMRASGWALVPLLALLIWMDFRRDRTPDFLRQRLGRYFERNGFTFAVETLAHEGKFYWRVLYQNRHERSCTAVVAFQPAIRFIGFGRPELGKVRVRIDCDGGAFGVAQVPYAIPQKYHGTKQRFELIATTDFPGGKGKLLRFREGLRVRETFVGGGDAVLTVLSAIAMHPLFSHPAIFKSRLPENVQAQAIGQPSQETLWRPGDPILS